MGVCLQISYIWVFPQGLQLKKSPCKKVFSGDWSLCWGIGLSIFLGRTSMASLMWVPIMNWSWNRRRQLRRLTQLPNRLSQYLVRWGLRGHKGLVTISTRRSMTKKVMPTSQNHGGEHIGQCSKLAKYFNCGKTRHIKKDCTLLNKDKK